MRRETSIVVLLASLIFASPASAIWNQTTFAIGGYNAYADTSALSRLHDAGIDFVVNSIQLADSAGSRAMVNALESLRTHHSGFNMMDLVYEEIPGSPKTLFKNLTPITNHSSIVNELSPASGLNNSSVAGWYIWDEPPLYYGDPGPPASQIFDAIHEMTKIVRDSTNGASTSNKIALITALPIFAQTQFPSCGTDSVTRYRCYLDEYLSTFSADSLPAPVLSFDMYPFETAAAYPHYFVTLASIRDKAMQYSRVNYRIPFWSVIQASTRQDSLGVPVTFNKIRWQAYVSLAYGAKGIFYWTLSPWAAGSPPYGESFLKADGTKNGALYDSLTALNAELRELGPTLMKLDPVATYHSAANGFFLPSGEGMLSDSNKVYNLVASDAGTNSNQGMVGYFKGRGAGDDYLLFVNKGTDSASTQSFAVTLGTTADTVYRFKKSTGQLVLVTTNASSFNTGLISPGGGELFKVVDKTYEYIPNVNQIVQSGSRTYYPHDKGVVMVEYSSGRRAYHRDGTAYTVVPQIAVGNGRVYIAQRSGNNGNVLRSTLDLDQPTLIFRDSTSSPPQPGQPVNSIVYNAGKLYVGETVTNGSSGRLVEIDSTGAIVASKTFLAPLNRLQIPTNTANALLIGEGTRAWIVNDSSPFIGPSWSDFPGKTVVAFATSPGSVYVAMDNGSSGKLVRLVSFPQGPQSTWTDGGTNPRVLDVSYSSSTRHLLVASSGSGGDKFTILDTLFTHSFGSRTVSGPRRGLNLGDTLGFLAGSAGVVKARGTNLAGQYRLVPDRTPRQYDFKLAFANPMLDDHSIMLTTSSQSQVRVEIFDLSGRRVAELVNRQLAAGEHSLLWTAKGSPRGMYFIRASSGDRTLVHKLTLLE